MARSRRARHPRPGPGPAGDTAPSWHPTPALARAVTVGAVGLAAAVLLGTPVVLVLAAPLLVHAVLALLHRPRDTDTGRDLARTITHTLDHRSLYEGQGTTSRLQLDGEVGAEHVIRLQQPGALVRFRPAGGVDGGLTDRELPVVEISPRRWGPRVVGAELVALTSPWSGYRAGPVSLDGVAMRVLPGLAPFRSRAQVPRPVGLVGSNRSQRVGSGTEFADIRPFRAGDRLRRISWRVSVRTQELHVTTSPAEQDSGVLLVLDALADHGRAGGVGESASSLDLTVRAASALASHHLGAGDRVALRVVGGDGAAIGLGAGARHLRRLQDVLSATRPGSLPEGIARRIRLHVGGGNLVLVLSPMLDPAIVTATASLARRGLPVVVVDTLPPDVHPDVAEGVDPRLADLAWRMRRLERQQVLGALAALGCPVAAWRGPGTVDEVLQRLARRAPAQSGSPG